MTRWSVTAGDCLKLMAEMPPASVDLIVTDPPYGIEYESNGGPRSADADIRQRTKVIGDGAVDPQWFRACFRALKENTAAYFFSCFDSFTDFRSGIIDAGFTVKTTLIWNKGNCGMGDLTGDYGNQTELCLYAVKGRRSLSGSRDRNILEFQRPCDAARIHPTQKPTDMLRYLIRKSSEKGQLVMDPFSGSGSTGVAALMEGRDFIGYEIREDYALASRQRIAAADQGGDQLDLFSTTTAIGPLSSEKQ